MVNNANFEARVKIIFEEMKGRQGEIKRLQGELARTKSQAKLVGKAFAKAESEMTAAAKKRSAAMRRAHKQIVRTTVVTKQLGLAQQKVMMGMNAWGRVVSKRTTEMRGGFQMWALSIMFFGMAIQRAFLGIMRSGLDMMTRLSEGQTEQSRALATLNAHWTFLKFTIGNAIMSALMPLLPIIIDLISRFTDWAEENPKLIGWLVILGVVIGTLLLGFGMMVLGLKGVFDAIGFVKGIGGIKGLIKAVGNLGKSFIKFIFSPAGLILLALAALIILIIGLKTNLFGIRDTMFRFKRWVWIGFGNLVIGVRKFIEKGKVIFRGFMDFISIVFREGINALFKPVIWLLNQMINAYNKLTGNDIKPISFDFGAGDDSLAALRGRIKNDLEQIDLRFMNDFNVLGFRVDQALAPQISGEENPFGGLANDSLGGGIFKWLGTPTQGALDSSSLLNGLNAGAGGTGDTTVNNTNDITFNVDGAGADGETLWKMLEPYMSTTQGLI